MPLSQQVLAKIVVMCYIEEVYLQFIISNIVKYIRTIRINTTTLFLSSFKFVVKILLDLLVTEKGFCEVCRI